MDNGKFFKDAGYGMMIHWGLYALLGGEYGRWRSPVDGVCVSEWIQYHRRIPVREYEKLASAFNPIYFNADEWVSIAEDAGMKYMVFTAKHHEGFAMYRSAHPFNIVDATPFGRDVVEELANACAKRGMKFGLYYSQDLDWHEINGGGYKCGVPEIDKSARGNMWDFPNDSEKNYSICFEEKIKPQVTELMKNYGDIFLVWFDMPHTISPEQSDELYALVKKYQPDCLINSRIGNGRGDYRSMGDNEVSDKYFGDELVETPATLNKTWGYKTFDNEWKSAEEVARTRKFLNERGVNYLLNVGPDYLGRIPLPSIEILAQAGKL